MHRSVVIIESLDSTIEQLERLTKKYNDRLFIISNEKRHEHRTNLIKVDVRKDLEQAKELIKTTVGKPDAIFTTAEMFMVQAATLAEYFGLLQNDMSVIYKNRDKELMKKIWKQKGIPTPIGEFFSSSSEVRKVQGTFTYPLIVKPSLGYASCGVKKVYSEEELNVQLNKIFLINSTVIAKKSSKM